MHRGKAVLGGDGPMEVYGVLRCVAREAVEVEDEGQSLHRLDIGRQVHQGFALHAAMTDDEHEVARDSAPADERGERFDVVTRKVARARPPHLEDPRG